MARKVYRLSEQDVKQIIYESVNRIMAENTDNEAFSYATRDVNGNLRGDFGGRTTRANNRVYTFKYAREFPAIYNQYMAIQNEIEQRINIILSAEQKQSAINENWMTSAGKAVWGGVKTVGKKLGSKTAQKWVGRASLATMIPMLLAPDKFANFMNRLADPSSISQIKPEEVIAQYNELTNGMQTLCQMIQEHPEILGAYSIDDEILAGPAEAEQENFGAGDVAEMAAGIGVTFIPYVGPILGLIDMAHSLFSMGARHTADKLKVVEQQIIYLKKAISSLGAVLTKTRNIQPGANQQVQQRQVPGQQQNYQQLPQERQLPNGYVIGQPAPFALYDPEQVARLQKYFGLPQTGRWTNDTQLKWDEWLRSTYKVAVKSIGRGFAG